MTKLENVPIQRMRIVNLLFIKYWMRLHIYRSGLTACYTGLTAFETTENQLHTWSPRYYFWSTLWGIKIAPFYYYPRYAMLARVIAIATCPSVRLSVCPSVTRRYCVKTKKASGMISSPSGSSKTLFCWRQISSPNSKGFPPNGGLKEG